MSAARDGMVADLVLVGGGHTHVQVLRRWMMAPLPGVRLSVVIDRPVAVYSGMVPGYVAGDYAEHELEIDVVPLARRAGARVFLAGAERIDPEARRIELEGRPAVRYDVASLDVGSTIRGLDLPGVREHALATRPIGRLVERVDERLRHAMARGGETLRVAIVGAGAAGLELAFTLRARLHATGRRADVTVVSDASEVMPGYPARVANRVRRAAASRGIRMRTGVRAAAVEKDAVWLGEERLDADLVLWATGAAPHPFLAASPLPKDASGFVRVRSTLEVVGHDALFAVGDCATLEDHAWVRKAGVYAVRQGPVLDANLRARLAGRRLRHYQPQRDFLTLLNLGGREALGAKWGTAFAGGWVWRWKDWIDRRFMRRFQVLDEAGAPAPTFPSPESMGMDPEEMTCGGCAAKVGASALEAALSRLSPAPEDASVRIGLSHPDDAASIELPRGDVLLATVDAFRAFADDPWLVGRVAAVNAASDVLAKGGRPRHAMALVTVPEEDASGAEEALFQVLSGVRAALDPLGVSLVGGHSTSGSELFVGLAVTGEPSGEVLALDRARPGEHLVLTKPLGTGVVLAADMRGLARGRWVQAAYAAMTRANDEATRVALEAGASACTDVSGFGFAGHLGELLRASGASAVIRASSLPALDGALALLARGVRSTYHAQNHRARSWLVADSALAGAPALELLFDPQTSGGLLFAVTPERSREAVAELRAAGDANAAVIGVVAEPRRDGALIEVAEAGAEASQ